MEKIKEIINTRLDKYEEYVLLKRNTVSGKVTWKVVLRTEFIEKLVEEFQASRDLP